MHRASVALASLASLGDDSCMFGYRHSRLPFDQDGHTNLRSDSGNPVKTFNFSRNGVPRLGLTHLFRVSPSITEGFIVVSYLRHQPFSCMYHTIRCLRLTAKVVRGHVCHGMEGGTGMHMRALSDILLSIHITL